MNQTAQPDLASLLASVEAAGIRLWPEGESIHYRTPNPITPEMRQAIIKSKPALIAHLGTWDSQGAIRLQIQADGLVERLGVPGSDPAIQDAARQCVDAGNRSDMAGVRAGCAKVESRAREIARNQTDQTANAKSAA